ncbi:MAG: type II toxin-antitoxin system RelE/ParE family toxin [Magnetococcales bacterium]|nr:type II toxin-antitoxin system RelE/ParE family toxin [Magnetococcales bacterium]MBF0114015.1 type II toxin-antitoxin system RelE/ParE family toxin [Magnetococcales bacterium]
MNGLPILDVVFYRTIAGTEPVRDWLRGLLVDDRKIIGEDIKLVQFRWPLGMPLVRKIEPGLWEVRSDLPNKRIVRVFFTVDGHDMVLLHAFVKKSQHTPPHELELARKRKGQYLGEIQDEQA